MTEEASVPEGGMKPSEVLSRAADLIEPEGAWTQENWWDGPTSTPESATCWCAEGAICRVEGRNYSVDVSMRAPCSFLARHLGVPPTGVPAWNNHPSRTQAEVVQALRDAAELAKAEGQ